MLWRIQSDEVIDDCKRYIRRGFRICCWSSQQAADVGILGTLLLRALFHLVPFIFQALFLYFCKGHPCTFQSLFFIKTLLFVIA